MLANSLADVVAEEAAMRFLHHLNLEPKRAERVGSVWQRGWLWYPDIWAKHEEAGGIYELDAYVWAKGGFHSVFSRKAGGRDLEFAPSSCEDTSAG